MIVDPVQREKLFGSKALLESSRKPMTSSIVFLNSIDHQDSELILRARRKLWAALEMLDAANELIARELASINDDHETP